MHYVWVFLIRCVLLAGNTSLFMKFSSTNKFNNAKDHFYEAHPEKRVLYFSSSKTVIVSISIIEKKYHIYVTWFWMECQPTYARPVILFIYTYPDSSLSPRLTDKTCLIHSPPDRVPGMGICNWSLAPFIDQSLHVLFKGWAPSINLFLMIRNSDAPWLVHMILFTLYLGVSSLLY